MVGDCGFGGGLDAIWMVVEASSQEKRLIGKVGVIFSCWVSKQSGRRHFKGMKRPWFSDQFVDH